MMPPKNDLFIESFGMEVALEIINYLDNYSVVALLNAVPKLRLNAILITDHSLPPMHFDIKGVTRKYINVIPSNIKQNDPLDSADLRIFSSLRDRQQIRLIELSHPDSDVELICDPTWLSVPLSRTNESIPLNNTSFLFIGHNGSVSESNNVLELVKRVDGFPVSVKMVVGTPTLHENDHDLKYGQALGTSCLNDSSLLYMNSLVTLRVKTHSICRDLSLPNLVKLSLVFTSMESEIPLLENIKAPVLSHLTVHYCHHPPIMRGIDVAGDASAGMESVFELAHIPSLQVNRQPFIHSTQKTGLNLRLYKSADMSFTKNFLVHNYIGVPLALVRLANLSKVEVVRWHISGPIGKAPVRLPECRVLEFYLNGSGATIPSLGSCPKVETLHMLICDFNVNISSIWDTMLPSLNRISIYQSLSLMKTSTFKEESIVVSVEAWEQFMLNTGPEIHDYKLSGFEMPFLDHFAHGSTISSPEHKIHVCPIISKASPYFSMTILMSGICHKGKDRLWSMCYLNIEPVFEDSNDRGKVELLLFDHLSLQGYDIQVITPIQDWSYVAVDYNKLLTTGLRSKMENADTNGNADPIKHCWDIPVFRPSIRNPGCFTRVRLDRDPQYRYTPLYR